LRNLRSTPNAEQFTLYSDGFEYEVRSEEIGNGEVLDDPAISKEDDEDQEDEGF
jgi:hypothetical protein